MPELPPTSLAEAKVIWFRLKAADVFMQFKRNQKMTGEQLKLILYPCSIQSLEYVAAVLNSEWALFEDNREIVAKLEVLIRETVLSLTQPTTED